MTIPRTRSRDLPDIVAALEEIIADQTARIAELERLVASLVWDEASSEMDTLAHMSHDDRVRFAIGCIENQDWPDQSIQEHGAEWLAAVREAMEKQAKP